MKKEFKKGDITICEIYNGTIYKLFTDVTEDSYNYIILHPDKDIETILEFDKEVFHEQCEESPEFYLGNIKNILTPLCKLLYNLDEKHVKSIEKLRSHY